MTQTQDLSILRQELLQGRNRFNGPAAFKQLSQAEEIWTAKQEPVVAGSSGLLLQKIIYVTDELNQQYVTHSQRRCKGSRRCRRNTVQSRWTLQRQVVYGAATLDGRSQLVRVRKIYGATVLTLSLLWHAVY